MPRYLCFLSLLISFALPAQERFQDPSTKLWGLKKDGNVILPAQYDKVKTWKNDGDTCACYGKYFLIKKGSKYGVADASGQVRIQPTYDDIGKQCKYGCLVEVKLAGMTGFLDDSLRPVIPCVHKTVWYDSHGHFLCYKADSFAVYNNSGKILLPMRHGHCSVVSDLTSSYGFFLEDEGKASYVALDGHVLIPEQTDLTYESAFNQIIGKKNGKYGSYDVKGHEKIPFVHDSLFDARGKFIGVMDHKKYGVLNKNGIAFIPAQYDTTISLEQLETVGRAEVRLNGKSGLLSSSGKQICAPIYDRIDFVETPLNDSLLVIVRNGKEGRMTIRGRVTIPPLYDEIVESHYTDGLFVVTKNGMCGLVTANHKIIIPAEYDNVYHRDHHVGSYIVTLNGESGIYDNGKYKLKDADRLYGVPKPVYDPWRYDPFRFPPDLDIVRLPVDSAPPKDTTPVPPPPRVASIAYEYVSGNNKYGLDDSTGKRVVPCEYDAQKFFINDLVVFEKGGATYLFNTKGKALLHYANTTAKEFDGEQLVLKTGSLFRVVDRKGKTIVPMLFNEIRRITDSLYLVQSGNVYGLYDVHGKQRVAVDNQAIYPCESLTVGAPDTSGYYPGGYLLVRKNLTTAPYSRRYGLIAPSGKLLTPIVYEKINFNGYGATEFLRGGNWYHLDARGKESKPVNVASKAIRAKYQSITPLIPGASDWQAQYYRVRLNGKQGAIDRFDSLIIPMQYDSVCAFSGKCGIVQQQGKYGIVDSTGKLVTPISYDTIIRSGVVLWNHKDRDRWYNKQEEELAYVVRKDGKYGVYAARSGKAPELIYDDYRTIHDRIPKKLYPVDRDMYSWPTASFKKGDQWFVIDEQGVVYPRPGIAFMLLSGSYPVTPCWDWEKKDEAE